MTFRSIRLAAWRPLVVLAAAVTLLSGAWAQDRTELRGDYIVAVVNQELVTFSDVKRRLASIEQEAARNGTRLPPRAQLISEIVNALIDERAQLSHARDTGVRVDEAELDRAVANVAAQNQLTAPQLRERLAAEGLDYARFRNNLRDQILLQRVREREVQARIRVTEAEIDDYLAQQRARQAGAAEYDIAQLLVAVPEGASESVVAERRAKAESLLAQARAGADFAALVRAHSDASREDGGRLGLRPASRLPELFVSAVEPLQSGEVAPALVRSGAGFHILKLHERRSASADWITQTRARHILLRLSPQLSAETALRRLGEYKRRIEQGEASFAQLAREYSEDGSASQGGDLGWASPGQFVPEFERVMDALPTGRLSEPFLSRFGAHLVQVTDRRQTRIDPREQRELARNVLRESKYEQAYEEWAREIRERAYIDIRVRPEL
ncbi:MULTISPECIES: peptidylprolyl isomerase [Caldimonas]|uniref:peptidylprolyl isomerase n=1 Tax=Caldimonas TaxID=196013 RepID=UPI000375DDE4|nr:MULTISPECIES: peptidylprolyl isomerase [Caldimonas]MCX7660194.1 peptidylprolyl isomerase [Caldimonas manganoxidans]